MKALVTGGGGFLGRAIVQRLLARGASVRTFSRGDYPDLRSQGVQVMQGDLAEYGAIRQACYDRDIVFHVAAKAGVWGRPEDFYSANVVGTRNVLAACRDRGISRLVYTSSPSVVFNGQDMQGVDESVPYPETFAAPYAATKAEAEKLVLATNNADLATVALRPHLIWGPGDTNLIPGILARGRQGKIQKIGRQPKLVDFTYIDNAADAHLLAGDRISTGSPIAGRAYFVTNGEPLEIWQFINAILAAAGIPPVRGSVHPAVAYLGGAVAETVWKTFQMRGEPPMTRFLARELSTAHWFNIGAARRDLGYEPKVTIGEGLQRLKEWIESSSTGNQIG